MSLVDIILGPRKKPSETQRIVSLPVREPQPVDLTERYRRPGGTMELRPVQSWALDEIEKNRGGVLLMGVGSGKTLVSYLSPVALGIDPEDTLVLIPAGLRATFESEGEKYAAHFRTSGSLPCLSYSELSRKKCAEYLEEAQPKLIVCDEAHYLKSSKAARTRRFLRYLRAHPDVLLVIMSGTLLSGSITDGAHLIGRTLGDGSPIPMAYSTLQYWAACIDVPRRLESAPTDYDWRRMSPLTESFGPGPMARIPGKERKSAVREAFHRRLITTPGIVHTTESSAPQSLYYQQLDTGLSPEAVALIDQADGAWIRPDGEELEDEMRVAELKRQLALGYYYTWEWGPDGQDTKWNEARLEYARAVRGYLRRDRPGCDTPGLVWAALEEGRDLGPELSSAWAAWAPIRDRCSPTPVPVVLDTEPIARVVRHARATVRRFRTRGIIWYSSQAEAEILGQLGVRVWAPGTSPAEDPGPTGEVVAMSVQSHGTGHNLQPWDSSWVLWVPSSGQTLEQLIGRTHRPGQESDAVWVWFVTPDRGSRRALKRAQELALQAEQTTGQRQKLLMGTWLNQKKI